LNRRDLYKGTTLEARENQYLLVVIQFATDILVEIRAGYSSWTDDDIDGDQKQPRDRMHEAARNKNF